MQPFTEGDSSPTVQSPSPVKEENKGEFFKKLTNSTIEQSEKIKQKVIEEYPNWKEKVKQGMNKSLELGEKAKDKIEELIGP